MLIGGGGFDSGSLISVSRYTHVVPNRYGGYITPNYVYRPDPVPYYGYSQNNYYYDQPGYYDAGYDSVGGELPGSLAIAEII